MITIIPETSVRPEDLFLRAVAKADVGSAVAEILETVRRDGDRAVLAYTRRFDGAELSCLEVSEQEKKDAFELLEPELLEALNRAARRIRSFHQAQVRGSLILAQEHGVVLGQKVTPLEKVGLYIPGGTAAYPSTVLMNAIPARIAGCRQVVMVTPPGTDGEINPAVLAAAAIAGVDKIYKCGGAQAVGALAYGTETIPRVDKIVGPGNAYVAEAKRQVFGRVAIDMIAGPSEILILADGKSDPAVVAADMLSQAEHDVLATSVLVTDSEQLAQAVSLELERQIPQLPRREIARKSIDTQGKILVVSDLKKGVELANSIAPEHLELFVDAPFAYLADIRNAGSVFLGRSCPEALGDYLAGPNHTLPTGGTARFSSPLSVDDFVKKIQYTYFTPEALETVAEDVEILARSEGLEAHARSVQIREEAGK